MTSEAPSFIADASEEQENPYEGKSLEELEALKKQHIEESRAAAQEWNDAVEKGDEAATEQADARQLATANKEIAVHNAIEEARAAAGDHR